METNNIDKSGRDDSPIPYRDHRDGSEETPIVNATDGGVSKNDVADQSDVERQRHQEFGNRKYEPYKENSSAADQPRIATGSDFS